LRTWRSGFRAYSRYFIAHTPNSAVVYLLPQMTVPPNRLGELLFDVPDLLPLEVAAEASQVHASR
jgi:hypothetical protein